MHLRGILKVKTNQESCAGHQYDEYKHQPRSSHSQSKSVTFHTASLVVYDDSSSPILLSNHDGTASKKASFAVVSKHYFPPLHQHQRQHQRQIQRQPERSKLYDHRTMVMSQHNHHGTRCRLNNRGGKMDIRETFTKPNRHANKILGIEEFPGRRVLQEPGQESTILEDQTNFDEIWNDDNGRNF